MHTIPEMFWSVSPRPRPARVTSVSPTRIYIEFDGRAIEFEREAYINDGRLTVPTVSDAIDAPLLAVTQKEAQARAARIADTERDALTARIRELKAARKRAKTEIADSKKRLKKLETAMTSHAR
jgi:hypothetical protein